MATNTQDNSHLPQAQQVSSQQPPPLPHNVLPPPLVQQHIQEHLQSQQSDQQHRQLPQLQQPQEQSLDGKALAYRQLLSNTETKLRQSHQTHGSTNMDPQNPQYAGSNSSNSTNDNSYSKGKEGGQGVLDGLLPRIETRGQGRGGGRHKQDDKSRGGKRQ